MLLEWYWLTLCFANETVDFNHSFVVGLACCGGALISTIYALYFYNSIYFGSLTPHALKSSDLSYIELSSLMPLLISTLFLVFTLITYSSLYW